MWFWFMPTFWCHINGLEQDCSISNALAMEILQSYTKPSIKPMFFFLIHVIAVPY